MCLAKSSFKSHRMAYLGYLEWYQYMQEMRGSVENQLEIVKQKDDLCFLGKYLRYRDFPRQTGDI